MGLMGRILDLPKFLTEFGVDFDLHDGWEKRGKDDFDPKLVVVHHTGMAGSAVNVCIQGRSDLPGPLCQIVLNRMGVAHVIASGTANHAGKGGWAGYTLNRHAIGIEADNNGRETWSAGQLDSFHRISAACLAMIGADPSHLCGHKEWAPGRKPDPHTLDMNEFRAAVGLDLQWWRNKKQSPKEDLSIVDADTKRYLDGRFDEIANTLAGYATDGGKRADGIGGNPKKRLSVIGKIAEALKIDR